MSAADQAERQYHPVSSRPEESSHSSPSIPTRTIHVLQPGIADHGHGGEDDVGKCEIPLVEQVFDRSPTKPKRNNSPLRDHRRAEKEREKVQHFLAAIAVNKANSRAQQAVTRDIPAHVSVPQYHAAAGLSREPICQGIVLQDLPSYEAPPHNYVLRGQRHRLSTTDGVHFQYRQVNPHPLHSSSQRSSSPERFLPPRDDSRMPVSGGYSQHSLQAPLTRGPPSEQRACLMIQVEPGVRAPLRGSDETWQAIQDDFYVPALCVVCDTTLFVIQDAAYVLCPDCRTVNAVDGEFVDRIAAGVGLGFKYDDLMRWQREILEERKNRTGARRVVTAEQRTRNDDGRSMSVYYGNS